MKKMNKYPLKKEDFDQLRNYNDWDIHEIDYNTINNIPNLPRGNDIVAAYASGDMVATKILNGIQSIFGMDIIVHEKNPKIEKKEPELNIYHMVIQKLKNPTNGYHYIMYGPFEEETRFGHWKESSVLDEYIKLTDLENFDK